MLSIRRKQLGISLLFYFKESEDFVPLSNMSLQRIYIERQHRGEEVMTPTQANPNTEYTQAIPQALHYSAWHTQKFLTF